MKRVVACLCLVCLTGCGAGHAGRPESPRPMANVLVYAKTPPRSGLGSKENVWRATVQGGHRQLIAKDATDPSVSPDGRWIAYDSGGNVFITPSTGGKPRIVYRHGGYPTWAPDSRHLAVSGAGIVVVDVRTGTKKTVASSGSISFSPDSTRVVIGREDQTGSDLYVTSIHGGIKRPVQITDDHQSFDPVWGPKGIAFIRFTHGPVSDIWLTGPRPNDAHQLTHMGGYIWPVSFSGDGKELLAAYPPMHNGQLWAVDVPSGHARPITPSLGDLVAQGLSTDGKTVLAAVGCGGTPSPYGYIETIPFTGGKPHVIARGPCRASWNAGY